MADEKKTSTATKNEEPAAAPVAPAEPQMEAVPAPYDVRFRLPFRFAGGINGSVNFTKDQVVSSQHYDVDLMIAQGAQLDMVDKDETTNAWTPIVNLNTGVSYA